MNLHLLFSDEAIKKIRTQEGAQWLAYPGFIATHPFDEIEACMGTFPIIPFITEDGAFSINTYLYAIAKGYVLLGFPVDNTSLAHQGMMRSFQSVRDFFRSIRPSEETVLLGYLTYNSSLMGMAHNLTHLRGIRNLVNPTLQYVE